MKSNTDHSFRPFRNEDWQSETPAAARRAVGIMRARLKNYCEGESHYKGVFGVAGRHLHAIRSEPEPSRKSALLDRALASLKVGIGQGLRAFAEEFVELAKAHKRIVDTVNWAFAQTHGAVWACLGLPEGGRIKGWLIHNSEPRESSPDLQLLINRLKERDESWRAPGWMKQHYLGDQACTEQELWGRVDERTTEAILKVIVQDVEMSLEQTLVNTFEEIELSLAVTSDPESREKREEEPPTAEISRTRSAIAAAHLTAKQKLDNPATNPYMSVAEVMNILGVKSRTTIYTYLDEGKMEERPRSKRAAKNSRKQILTSSVAEFLNNLREE